MRNKLGRRNISYKVPITWVAIDNGREQADATGQVNFTKSAPAHRRSGRASKRIFNVKSPEDAKNT